MKKSLHFFVVMLLVCGIYQACSPEDLVGSIYGTVVDKATGEPIKSAGVELSPSGLKTVTGSEGQFEFAELSPNRYTLIITKTGYIENDNVTIEVKPGQQAKGDVQIEKLPPALKVVDDNRQEIDTLDFGSDNDDVARSFCIFNDGVETLEWQITTTADWIKSVSKTEGVLSAGYPQSLIVIIDRTKLNTGENKTTIHITSNNGSKQLTIIATGPILATLNTLAATNVKTTTATLNGEILTEGSPKYTERGFVYSESPMPTLNNCIQKVTSALTDSKTYSETIIGLTKGQTYYCRAYTISAGREVYSTNEVSFVPNNVYLPEVETVSAVVVGNNSAYFIGNIIDNGDPEYTERGFLYATNQYPTYNDVSVTKVIVVKNSSTQFEKQVHINGLSQTVFYVRAYAKSSEGVSYGEIVKLIANENLEYTTLPTFMHASSTYRVHPEFNVTEVDWFQAMSMCENLTYGGYSDWMLPTKDVLYTMYLHKNDIGDFMDYYWNSSAEEAYYFYYWASTEYSNDANIAWQQGFLYGDQSLDYKSSSYDSDENYSNVFFLYRARCVRKEN